MRLGGAELREMLPQRAGTSPLRARSAIASTFLAGLELVRQDQVSMRQECVVGPIHELTGLLLEVRVESAERPSEPPTILNGGNSIL